MWFCIRNGRVVFFYDLSKAYLKLGLFYFSFFSKYNTFFAPWHEFRIFIDIFHNAVHEFHRMPEKSSNTICNFMQFSCKNLGLHCTYLTSFLCEYSSLRLVRTFANLLRLLSLLLVLIEDLMQSWCTDRPNFKFVTERCEWATLLNSKRFELAVLINLVTFKSVRCLDAIGC